MRIAGAAFAGIAIILPAAADTDVKVLSVQGICTELRIGTRNFACDRLVTIYTTHSRRTAFELETSVGSISFAGGRSMQLGADTYLLFVETVTVHGKDRPATGECNATLGRDSRSVRFLTCDAEYDGVQISARFRSGGKSSKRAL